MPGGADVAAVAAIRDVGSYVDAIVDYNRQQAMGATDDIVSLGDLRLRWEAFGWRAVAVDGHDEVAIRKALSPPERETSQPLAVIASTTFGKGVGFMERQLRWHYASMTDDDHARAVASLDGIR